MTFFSLKIPSTLIALSSIALTFANNMDSSDDNSKMTSTTAASPVVTHGFDVFILADFLYWTAREDNLDYAITGIAQTGETAPSFSNSQSNQTTPKNKMDPGFKVGVGLDLKHDGWDSLIKYTWFHNKAHTNASFNNHTPSIWGFSPALEFNFKSTSITKAIADWALHFNNLDWELGRNFYLSPKLLLRPHIGLKGSWQKQTYTINELELTDHFIFKNSASSISIDKTTTGSYLIDNMQHFWGVGIRCGFNTSWQFTDQWSLFGDSSLASLWGQFQVSRKDTGSQVSNDTAITTAKDLLVIDTKRQFHTIIPVLEFLLGIRWDYKFSNDDYRIRLQAGWEEQVWFNQNQFTQSFSAYGNLSLQGLSLGARLDF